MHQTDANDDNLKPANAQVCIEVTPDQLPLSCPMPDQHLWNSHPRVYLPIEATGEAVCPYCGTRYKLTRVKLAD